MFLLGMFCREFGGILSFGRSFAGKYGGDTLLGMAQLKMRRWFSFECGFA